MSFHCYGQKSGPNIVLFLLFRLPDLAPTAIYPVPVHPVGSRDRVARVLDPVPSSCTILSGVEWMRGDKIEERCDEVQWNRKTAMCLNEVSM